MTQPGFWFILEEEREVSNMVGFLNALSACLVLLMLMSVGYFMGIAGWMTAKMVFELSV